MDKKELQKNKENQLLSLMALKPEFVNPLIFSKIPIDNFSITNRILFESIKQRNNIDRTGVFFEIESKGYLYQIDDIKELLEYIEDEFSFNSRINNIVEHRIKEFFDVVLSISSDELLSNKLDESKNSFKGLEILESTKDEIETKLISIPTFIQPETFNDSIDSIIDRLENRFKKGDLYKSNNTPSFNTATGGISEGNLIGIAGAYKNGKTTLGINLVLDFASQNIPIAIYSLEMTKSEIQEKILSYKTGIDYEKIREPKKLSKDETLKIARFKNSINENEKIFIQDAEIKLSEIENSVKKLANENGVKIVLIDYLNLIKGFSKNIENREREISYYSNQLKILAKETKTIIFVLTQLNRTGTKDASSINLAESIALARDCDFLFTILKPINLEVKKVKLNSMDIPINENHFLVKLDISRHSKSGNQFLLLMENSGVMKEIETKFDNSFTERNINSFYETEVLI